MQKIKKKTQLYWKYPSAVFCNLEDWKEIYRDLVYSIIVCQEPAGEWEHTTPLYSCNFLYLDCGLKHTINAEIGRAHV